MATAAASAYAKVVTKKRQVSVSHMSTTSDTRWDQSPVVNGVTNLAPINGRYKSATGVTTLLTVFLIQAISVAIL